MAVFDRREAEASPGWWRPVGLGRLPTITNRNTASFGRSLIAKRADEPSPSIIFHTRGPSSSTRRCLLTTLAFRYKNATYTGLYLCDNCDNDLCGCLPGGGGLSNQLCRWADGCQPPEDGSILRPRGRRRSLVDAASTIETSPL